MMRFLEKCKIFFHIKWSIFISDKKCFVFRPCYCSIAKSVKLMIAKAAFINIPWNNHFKRNLTGVFTLEKNASFYCEDFAFHSGIKIQVEEDASLKIGSGYMNTNCEIRCKRSITIGKDVFIGNDVIIRDSDAHSIKGVPSEKPVVIGDHVWIGARAMILKGVTIGDGAVIAAGSIVTHDVPPRSLAAGVPARIAKQEIEWN